MGRGKSGAFAVALVVAALLAGCAGPPTSEPAPPAPAGDGAFPVTVEHAFGATVVPAAPQRIVSAGYSEQDVLLSLGVTPVGVTEWYGEHPSATWPWAQDELGDAAPEVLNIDDGFQYERIAALEPDLIVATNAGVDQASYERLSAIAPTIAQPAGATAFFSPWDGQTLHIGRALGREREAQEVVDGVNARFAAVAAEHPQFAGTPAIFLQAPYYNGAALAYPEGLSTNFLTDLGFVVPDALDPFVPADADVFGQASIPLEQLGTLNAADVLIWATEDAEARTALEEQAVYRQLTPVREGNLVFTDAVLAGAIYFTTPLSLPYVLDNLVPLLEKAVAGNPETVPAV
ncbi:ABC transporter substrate-binding protein [Pseudonocardia sp. MH-G8]|uniref:ABC transporter substrate-binding protein n=1 Tax=Pseudonocardia sp. MH-G8 TaxID=1854588 RepID=UPI000B9FBDE3|nr:ABC transporter substrate-binding protein [Pseudonocardia sp. MH-G8]OZM81165.1 ABC transporter substrate-binding protein [Pseudonocardia sp. MH-G8]